MDVFQRILGVRDSQGRPVDSQRLKGLYKQSVGIAWPSTVEGALLSIIGRIDTMMVGTLGPAAIAAVGLTSQPRMILLICAQALCVGTTALCARRKGADDPAAANSCLSQSLGLVTVLGALMTLLGYFGAGGFMRLAGANEDTMEMSVAYFRIISLGMLFNCWSLCICAAMRAIGKTRITMVTNITANLVNVCLNYVLINGKLGFPRLGVRSAAIATLCGTMVSCFIAIGFVCKKGGYYHLSLPKFDRITLQGLFRVGTSSILEMGCLRVGFLITSRLVADIGTNAFAAYQIVSQVTSLSFTLGDGISAAGTSLVGQSLGARERDLAMIHVRIARRLSVIVSVALMLVIFLLRRQLALLFTNSEEIIVGVTLSFYVVIAGMLAQNGRVVYSGCLRGAGDVRYVAVCALISVTVLRPILTYLFCYPIARAVPALPIAVAGPWVAFDIDAYVRNYLLARRIKHGRWMDIKLT